MTIEIYISTDIEADGPIPGPHSMLSIGSAAYTADKQLVSTFTANLEVLPGAEGHPKTMSWWSEQPDAWAACRANAHPPREVMQSYYSWLIGLPGKPIFVAYPAAYDFMFVYWYLMTFVGDSPFQHSALDIRSYAMAYLKQDYSKSGKNDLPAAWLENLPLAHVALDDAIQQGKLFCNLLQANLQG
jgi:hypothetical protein